MTEEEYKDEKEKSCCSVDFLVPTSFVALRLLCLFFVSCPLFLPLFAY